MAAFAVNRVRPKDERDRPSAGRRSALWPPTFSATTSPMAPPCVVNQSRKVTWVVTPADRRSAPSVVDDARGAQDVLDRPASALAARRAGPPQRGRGANAHQCVARTVLPVRR